MFTSGIVGKIPVLGSSSDGSSSPKSPSGSEDFIIDTSDEDAAFEVWWSTFVAKNAESANLSKANSFVANPDNKILVIQLYEKLKQDPQVAFDDMTLDEFGKEVTKEIERQKLKSLSKSAKDWFKSFLISWSRNPKADFHIILKLINFFTRRPRVLRKIYTNDVNLFAYSEIVTELDFDLAGIIDRIYSQK